MDVKEVHLKDLHFATAAYMKLVGTWGHRIRVCDN